jgi:hypothetical protein
MVCGLGRCGGNLDCLMMQVAVLEEQKNEATEIDEVAEKVEDEPNPVEADSTAAEPTSKNETLDEKPDINDVPMEESEVNLCSSLHVHFMFIYILMYFSGM